MVIMDLGSVFKKIFTGYAALWVATFMLFLFMGCATIHVEQYIKPKLDDPISMYKIYDVRPMNLATRAKCKTLPTVRIINDEIRTEAFEVIKASIGNPHVVIPKEIVDMAAAHLKYGYEQSNIKIDEQSKKVLHLTMKDMFSTPGVWTHGLRFKMGINIPEINFQKDYEATESSMLLSAFAGAIHLVTRQIIDDPVIQDYLLCSNTRETALDILKKRYVRGEITKDQFERMKNDIKK